jgi:DNA-binding LacI/PurR family transcriptional regulator
MPKKVTLADVAELANVAVGTASEALNRRTGIAPATRDRVLTAARQLGYDQRIPFEEPKRTSLKSVGVIKHEQHDYPGFDPFYFPVVAGIERRCQGDGLTMTYATCEVDQSNRMTRLPSTLSAARLDGLIIVGAFVPRSFARELCSLSFPVVLVDGYAEGTRFDRILTNNVDGACEAVAYLIHNGHHHIGLIGSCEECYPSIRERREGYLRALQRNNVGDVYIEDSPLNRQAAHDATLRLLERAPHLTALFVVNDNAAFGAIAAARSLGYDVPERLSVVGFDDIMFAADMTPPLTTMRIDKTRMGDLAVQMLAYRAANPDAPVMTWSLDTTLVERKSVQAVRTTRKASNLPGKEVTGAK